MFFYDEKLFQACSKRLSELSCAAFRSQLGQVFIDFGPLFSLFVLINFRVVFLIDFWSFWGVILGAFSVPRSTQDGPSWA